MTFAIQLTPRHLWLGRKFTQAVANQNRIIGANRKLPAKLYRRRNYWFNLAWKLMDEAKAQNLDIWKLSRYAQKN